MSAPPCSRPTGPAPAPRPLSDVDLGRATLDDVVEQNRGFVVTIARQYRRSGLPLDDLLSAGHLGLIEAARRYDPSRGARFVTYAVWWIRKSMIETIERQASIVSIPPYQRRLARRVESDPGAPLRARRPPVAAILEVRLDDRFGTDETPRRELPSRAADPEVVVIEEQQIGRLRAAVAALPEREREVLRHRFGLDDAPVLSLQEIGARLGLSRERVRQIEVGALAVLRRAGGAATLRRAGGAPTRRAEGHRPGR